MTICSLAGQQALDDGLGGDAGVIFARHPQGIIALHAMVANQDVFDGSGDSMPKVQRAGDVGRWHTDGKGLSLSIWTRLKVATFFPETIPLALDYPWLIRFWQG